MDRDFLSLGRINKPELKHILVFIALLISVSALPAQDGEWDWWNNLHGWKPGMPSWKTMIKISPGYLGPNALPVPEIKKGYIAEKGEFEFGAEYHFKTGDPTKDIFSKLYIPFAHGKIAFEAYGVIVERYSMSEKIRDERLARDRDGKGWAQGDFYFSTLIQLTRGRKFPDTMFRIAGRTASGGAFDAARYSDSPGYFLDLSFSKSVPAAGRKLLVPYFSVGFYSWQTNDEFTLQNDAFLYGAGIELSAGTWHSSGSFSGYKGYKTQRDNPMLIGFDIRKDLKNNALRLQVLNGLHGWQYTTARLSFICYLKEIN